MPKQLVRICPFDRFCRVQNLPTSSVELIWPITELYFRQILSTGFMNRLYLDVKTGPNENHNADETGGDTGGALGHTQPFVRSVGGAESSQGDSNWVDD